MAVELRVGGRSSELEVQLQVGGVAPSRRYDRKGWPTWHHEHECVGWAMGCWAPRKPGKRTVILVPVIIHGYMYFSPTIQLRNIAASPPSPPPIVQDHRPFPTGSRPSREA